jgi:phosphoribosylformylglycinamidine synthase
MKVIVNIYLKNGILDSQGKVVHNALDNLGFSKQLEDVRIGKQITLDLKTTNKDEATKISQDMCKQLLVNNVIEDYNIKID